LSALNYELRQFPNSEALALAAAQDWSRELTTSRFVALSGGRIAVQFFNAVVGLAPNLEKVHFFWADERCVPADHAESNYGTARKLLFEPLRIPIAHIHRIRGEENPEIAAKLATDELLAVAPKLDLVFLGMGEDGHVASLFPGMPPQPGVYYSVIGPKPPPQRITVSYEVLAAAREVWVFVSGTGKEMALSRSLASVGDTPLARVINSRTNTKIFCDFRLGHDVSSSG
jgi:6-phosphogluconolactonase